ncbi:unnamed protein product [Bursaphelenchus xylophilus]|nr:unnamed protein product [Bursaphelenchus xylophilus]CAG9126691.1 unnamed protein product [Bursaphelenchus xylophilus]
MRYPNRNNTEQLFIFYEREPPIRYPADAQLPLDYFNATATFHSTSDIPVFYGRYLEDPKNMTKTDYRNKLLRAAKKKQRGAFFVHSHCQTQSRRQDIMSILRK